MENSEDQPVEYIGVGKPEMEGKPHPVVEKVKHVLGRWWERVGPGSVEKSWVSAHGRILNKIDGEERKHAFEKSAETWRKVGKGLGIASTAVDFSLGGLGIFLSVRGFQNPVGAENRFYRVLNFIGTSVRPTSFLHNAYHDILPRDDSLAGVALENAPRQRAIAGRIISGLTGVGSAETFLGTGPAHIASRVAARAAGVLGQGIAGSGNYVASGKAREHADKIGSGLGKGIGSVAKYAAEHPDEVRKTFETVERARRENEQHREAVARAQREEAQRQLKHDYEEWLKGMDPALKAYYVNSNTWPPPMETMMQERARQSNSQQPKNRI